MCHSSKKTSQSRTSTQPKVVQEVQPKVVQEVQAQEDQNTGNKTKNVDTVEMIRSMGLCERHAKNTQNVNVQEMSIVHELGDKNPVFYTPVLPQIVTATWEQVSDLVMELEFCVATPVEHLQEYCAFETKQINVIMVHDMELKSAHYSNVTINGQVVQIKQDTGAEVNVMPKSMFDILSTSNTTKLLNKAKSMKISGYGENPIDYLGMCVFKVNHNSQRRDALFFITNVNDTKVILGVKTCQELGLVKIICDD